MSFKAEIKTIGLHSRPLLVVASRRVIQFLQHSTTSSQNIFTMHEISRALHQTHGLVLGAAVGLGFGLSLSYYLARQQRARHAIHSKSPEAELVGQVYAERGKATTTVYIVGAGPGAVDLISLRGYLLLQRADVVLHDRLVSPKLLCCVKSGTKLINVGKAPQKKRFQQSEINKILIEEAKTCAPGSIILRLKGGDPFVFGLGGDEILALDKEQIRYEVVPGLTSATAVPGYLGIPVTQKGVATSFTVLSGHVPPGGEGAADWDNLPVRSSTLVVLMGVRNLPKICEHLLSRNWSNETPVALIQSGTTVGEALQLTDLTSAPQAAQRMGLKSPAIIVIGDVCTCLPKGESATNQLEAPSDDSEVWGAARKPV